MYYARKRMYNHMASFFSKLFGGSGNKYGAILGGALVSYIPLRFTAVADYKYLIFGAALVIMMLFRPQGLLGHGGWRFVIILPETTLCIALPAVRESGQKVGDVPS